MKKNQIIGITLGLVSTGFLFMTSQLPKSKYSTDVGPEVFPYIAAGGLLLCAIGIFFQKEKDQDKRPFLDKQGWLRVLKLALVLGVYPFLFHYIGFILSSMMLLFSMIRMFDIEKKTALWKVGLVTVIITFSLFAVFTFVLNAVLPAGEMFNFLKG